MMQEIAKLQLEQWARELCIPLREFLTQKRLEPSYITSICAQDLQRVFCVVNYFDLMPNMLSSVDLSSGPINYLRIIVEFNKLQLGPQTIFGVLKIFQALSTETVEQQQHEVAF